MDALKLCFVLIGLFVCLLDYVCLNVYLVMSKNWLQAIVRLALFVGFMAGINWLGEIHSSVGLVGFSLGVFVPFMLRLTAE